MGAPALLNTPEDDAVIVPNPANSDVPEYGQATRTWFDGGELAAHLEAGKRAERWRMIIAVIASAAVILGTITLLAFID